ncbi:hypothetical protein N7520_010906 [Penicillium odoratum]|uniref:uncharacterized protein n=1 Tax=Penicillium odoratum TaxID=1167516 RepID=UPI002548A47E|nr:uncharacterized protein N7520_010906 [Penicillium odoratum]KAJ5745724.1 hypothetical protein N7520_010906 [Penicillium odoratum]
MGHQEAQDGAEFVTWLSRQPWCNGRVGLTGNSWLAMSQWKIGSLRPEGLEALAPCYGKLEDLSGAVKIYPLWNEYWEDKHSKCDQINIPTYVVASWTNPIRTSGTLRAYRAIPDSVPKWLRVHNCQEWPDYYADSSCRDLKRFFDYFLKGKKDNGWKTTPRVRLSILNFGLSGLEDTVNRSEREWPLARTKYKKLYLTSNQQMGPSLQDQGPCSVTYDSRSGKAIFRYRIPEDMETTGYFVHRLAVSCELDTDMDLFVQVCCLRGKSLFKQGVLTIRPNNAVVLRLLKLLHDWQILLQGVGMLLHWGPMGQLRVSHGHQKSPLSTSFEPLYEHKEKVPLVKGEVRVVEIPLRPYGMYWQKGDIMEFSVSGKPVLPFPIPGVQPLEGKNTGTHVIHCLNSGENSSCLIIPCV